MPVRVRVKNLPQTWVTFETHLGPKTLANLEFFIDKAGRLIQKNVLGQKTVIPPPYTIERPSPYGQVITRVK